MTGVCRVCGGRAFVVVDEVDGTRLIRTHPDPDPDHGDLVCAGSTRPPVSRSVRL